MTPKVVVVIADPHCGSTVGLCPPDFPIHDGATYRLNKQQEWLWAQYTDFLEWKARIIGSDPFILVVNGDAVEGEHHRSKQVISTDTGVMTACAIDVLARAATGAAGVYITHGTEAHVGHSTESQIGFSLGAQRAPDGYFFRQRWLLEINGVLCSFRHHMTTTKRKHLEAGAMSAEAGNEQLNAARYGHPVPRVMCRAHRHLYGSYEDGFCTFVASPPWKLLDNFVHKVAAGTIAAVGAYMLDFRDRPEGELPDVRKFIRSYRED